MYLLLDSEKRMTLGSFTPVSHRVFQPCYWLFGRSPLCHTGYSSTVTDSLVVHPCVTPGIPALRSFTPVSHWVFQPCYWLFGCSPLCHTGYSRTVTDSSVVHPCVTLSIPGLLLTLRSFTPVSHWVFQHCYWLFGHSPLCHTEYSSPVTDSLVVHPCVTLGIPALRSFTPVSHRVLQHCYWLFGHSPLCHTRYYCPVSDSSVVHPCVTSGIPAVCLKKCLIQFWLTTLAVSSSRRHAVPVSHISWYLWISTEAQPVSEDTGILGVSHMTRDSSTGDHNISFVKWPSNRICPLMCSSTVCGTGWKMTSVFGNENK